MLAYFDVLYPTLLPTLTFIHSAVLEDAGIESRSDVRGEIQMIPESAYKSSASKN
jgi:hypothetical protein